MDDTKNNGGKTDYYQLPKDENGNVTIDDADDFIEHRKMNFAQGVMTKVVWTFNVGRHSGTDYIRDLNKLKHYADRELNRFKEENERDN